MTRSDWASAGELIKILEEAEQDVPDELRDMKKRFEDMQERKERERQSLGGSGGGRRLVIICNKKNQNATKANRL